MAVVPHSGEIYKLVPASAAVAIVMLAQVCCKFSRTGRMQSSDSDSSAGTSSISKSLRPKSSRFTICIMQRSQNSAKYYSTWNHKGPSHCRKKANLPSKRNLQCPYHLKLTSRRGLRSKLKKKYWTRHMWEIGVLTKEYCKLLRLLVNLLQEALIEKVFWEASQITLIIETRRGKTQNLESSTSPTSTTEEETSLLHQLLPSGRHLTPHCIEFPKELIVVELQSLHWERLLPMKYAKSSEFH